jgi:TctA family transporter
MKRREAAALPRYLAVNAILGGCVGAIFGAVLLFTDVVGLAELARRDPAALVLVPALAGLFAACAMASAMGWLTSRDDEAAIRGTRDDRLRPAKVPVAARR